MQNLIISKLEDRAEIPYDLLLLADPSQKNIDTYLSSGSLYQASVDGRRIACYVLSLIDHHTIEVKNIAVQPEYQNKGIGTLLLKDAIEKAKAAGMKEIIIGTGNSSIGQLYLYQKSGFRITQIKTNFFKENYPNPIFENGIACTDMIVLSKKL